MSSSSSSSAAHRVEWKKRDNDGISIGSLDERERVEDAEKVDAQISADNDRHVLMQFAKQRGATDPLVRFSRGSGWHFYDLYGRKYLDFGAQLFNLALGHQHPGVVEAVREQASRQCYVRPTVNVYSARSELARELASVAPGDLNQVYFGTGGSDVVEYALKVARMVTGREKVCSFYRSYHGSTLGVKSVGGDAKNWAGGMSMAGAYKVHNPYAYRCPFGYKDGAPLEVYVRHVIDTIEYEGPHLTAAFIMETVAGSAGMILLPPPGFLRAIRDYCAQKGIMFIADEVMTGFGRCGDWFAIQRFDGGDVVPDMITCAKAISNGAVPLGALIVSDRVAAHFDERVLYIGLTNSGHPLACAAALATIRAFRAERVLERVRRRETLLAERLAALKDKHTCVGDVRSIGLLGVIELVECRESHAPIADEQRLAAMRKHFIDAGLYLFARWHYILVVPPLVISKRALLQGLDMIDSAIAQFFPNKEE
jgi:taurine---2-oxoglutarate transaminase